jgi:hypothetical protein
VNTEYPKPISILHDAFSRILKKDVIATYMQDGKYPYTKPSDIAMISVGALAILLGLLADIFLSIFSVQPRWFVRICLMLLRHCCDLRRRMALDIDASGCGNQIDPLPVPR